jgi:hypothetical protein
MRRIFASLAILAGLILAPAAHADTFDFTLSGSGGGFSGTGVITANELTTGVFSITDITGTGVTGLLSPFTFFGNDNILYPNSPDLVDILGFSFTDQNSQGIFDVNIFGLGGGHTYAALQDQDGFHETIPITFTLSPAAAVTPEPSSLVLLATGMFGMIVFARKRLFGL